MPTITNETIRALYELYGNDDYPVEEYCIGCANCEYYSFPCANCAAYVFNGQLGEGNSSVPLNDIDNMIEDTSDDIIDVNNEESSIPMDVDDDDNDIIPSNELDTSHDDLDIIQNDIELVRNLNPDPNISRRASY